MLHAWRLGGQVLWADLASRTGAQSPEEVRQLVGAAGELWGVTERFSTEMALSYHTSEQERLGGVELRHTMILDALLDGRAAEVRAEAEHLLDLGRGRNFVVAVAETSGEHQVSPRELTQALQRRGLRSAWRLRTGCQVGIIGVDDGRVGEVAAALREHAVSRIGVSQTLTALMEVGAEYRMTMLAMATLPAHRRGAVALDDCLPDALALSSPELADRMVAVPFGPVLALPAAEREELLRTTSVWIRSLGSTLRAAKSLYCHRNTVLNRLRRLESLTHLDLSDVTVAAGAAGPVHPPPRRPPPGGTRLGVTAPAHDERRRRGAPTTAVVGTPGRQLTGRRWRSRRGRCRSRRSRWRFPGSSPCRPAG
ncbi:helix-turn-helix domain-containing protein [Saccharopolyspora sp. NFXS83]|uniref:PucR family transcriptional regulator n=1 Tax=Saccharopolyspora sp. NFXS83 TaxID=2993560 RepID=UPI00224B62CC|nr:helix-turn-helix domain-containing protein [Saccharopolyspora sp. NFXS83]MCX2730507.1 helix-turn-helix domain-containing protein [Saccharopolyspora sp. NFXS83]